MAIFTYNEFYSSILIVGLIYFAFSRLVDADILLGPYSLGIPYGLIGWGMSGLLSENGVSSFLWGFLFIYASITAMYLYLTVHHSRHEKYLLKLGEVTIPIKPDKIGEIRIHRDGGYDFLSAYAKNIDKTIEKGDSVRVIDFDGVVAVVSTDQQKIVLENKFSRFYNQISKAVQLLLVKSRYSGVCMVCYGNINKSKKAIKCPSCGSIAHSDHLKDWLDIRSKCPNCRTKLKLEGSKITITI
ncbi:MAG: hypothetical protein HeimC2_38500 [Candidatus Heimdallarchaeota archaeon LC_2]|nr:MAG: hypothetical protein HeimC2_38500 [Candidatus Heimdallarchaeota archaeon LC_2]